MFDNEIIECGIYSARPSFPWPVAPGREEGSSFQGDFPHLRISFPSNDHPESIASFDSQQAQIITVVSKHSIPLLDHPSALANPVLLIQIPLFPASQRSPTINYLSHPHAAAEADRDLAHARGVYQSVQERRRTHRVGQRSEGKDALADDGTISSARYSGHVEASRQDYLEGEGRMHI